MSKTAYLWSSPSVSLTALTIFAALYVATGMVIFGHSSNFMLLLKSSYLWSVRVCSKAFSMDSCCFAALTLPGRSTVLCPKSVKSA